MEKCILVEDSVAVQMQGLLPVFRILLLWQTRIIRQSDHPLVTPFHHMEDLPALWRERGWNIYQS